MKRLFVLSWIVLFVLSGCNNSGSHASEDIKNLVTSEFKEVGIELTPKDGQSQTFDYPISKEENYEFEGGAVYLFYDFGKIERLKEELKTTLAETEFLYPPLVEYSEEFVLVYIPDTDDKEVYEKVEIVFDSL